MYEQKKTDNRNPCACNLRVGTAGNGNALLPHPVDLPAKLRLADAQRLLDLSALFAVLLPGAEQL